MRIFFVGEQEGRTLGEATVEERSRLRPDWGRLVFEGCYKAVFLHSLHPKDGIYGVHGVSKGGDHVQLLLFQFLQQGGQTVVAQLLEVISQTLMENR